MLRGENWKRVLHTSMTDTQTWRKTWGPPVVFSAQGVSLASTTGMFWDKTMNVLAVN